MSDLLSPKVTEEISIEIVYAEEGVQSCSRYSFPEGTTFREATNSVSLPSWTQAAPCGIWGIKVSPDTLLKQGDRVEFYKPLTLSPQEARRLRAKKKRLNDLRLRITSK